MIRDSERSVAINRQSGQHRITAGVPEACCNGLYNTALCSATITETCLADREQCYATWRQILFDKLNVTVFG